MASCQAEVHASLKASTLTTAHFDIRNNIVGQSCFIGTGKKTGYVVTRMVSNFKMLPRARPGRHAVYKTAVLPLSHASSLHFSAAYKAERFELPHFCQSLPILCRTRLHVRERFRSGCSASLRPKAGDGGTFTPSEIPTEGCSSLMFSRNGSHSRGGVRDHSWCRSRSTGSPRPAGSYH